MTTTTTPSEPTAASCQEARKLLSAHLDGHLDAVRTLDIEEHLASCSECRDIVALEQAICGSLRRSVKQTMPEEARARMLALVAAECSSEDTTARASHEATEETRRDLAVLSVAKEAREPKRRALLFGAVLPLASAAALVLGWKLTHHDALAIGSPNTEELLKASLMGNDLVHEFVAVHSHPLSPERTDPREVRALERDVGVPVRLPRFKGNARFVGGRVLPVHQGSERAAMLQYELVKDDAVQRLSVFVYDPRRVHVSGPGLARKAVGAAEVHVGQAQGYSVAVTQRGDVGYAFTSDLDPETSATLAANVE